MALHCRPKLRQVSDRLIFVISHPIILSKRVFVFQLFSYVTHESKHFIYFYMGQVAILLFKSG